MSERLIKALQRGGVTTRLERDQWGVWRGQDRRRRRIGMLSGKDIELLRLRGLLARFGDSEPPILIWSGSTTPIKDSQSGAKVLRKSAEIERRSLIEHVVANCADVPMRTAFRIMVQAYRDDFDCAARGERSPGMNWSGLALGGRVQGGRPIDDGAWSAHVSEAKSRLARVANCLAQEDLRFLHAMIVVDASKSKMARQFQIRASLLERRAIAILRTLREASIYV